MSDDYKVFEEDVARYGTYVYASGETLSIDLSSKRRCKSIHGIHSFAGKKILDIGCGDGIYTYELLQTKPELVVGIDPIENVISHAREKYKDIPNLQFECKNLYEMEIPSAPLYDIVVLRGVLHHVPDLAEAIRIAGLLAKTVIVLEPNGYNLMLKIIEKTSAYHIAHKEQSFTPTMLRSAFSRNGGTIIKDEYIGLVPTFCPDWLTRMLKYAEPIVESIPVIRNILCGQYVFVVEMQAA